MTGPDADAVTAGVRPRGSWSARLRHGLAVLLAGVLLAVFGVTTVGVDGASMAPTLQDGDRALVPRYETWSVRGGWASWRAGAVVYFRPPGAVPRNWFERLGGGPFLIKRVAAVAGQTVELRRGQLWIDGAVAAEPYLDDGPAAGAGYGPEWVPPDHLFLLGDNRSPLASRDSRAFGPVPVSQVAGRAAWIVWPWWRVDADGVWRLNVRRL